MRSYWLLPTIDSTTTHMMITIKLTQFITEVYYNKYQDRSPSLIEFLGFIYFVPSVLAGPVLSYDEYSNFIRYSKGVTCEALKHFALSPKPPLKICCKSPPCHSNLHDNTDTPHHVTILCLKSILLLILAMIGVMWFNTLYLTTDTFYELGIVSKLLILYITMFLMRCKYYCIWTLSEIAYIMSGSSTFVKYRGRNVDILDVETADNIYTLTNGWNKKTNAWLKDCVYKPLMHSGYSKFVCIISTNLVSSVWHGFYPGYYITFVLGGATTLLGQIWRKQIILESRYYSLNRLYDIVRMVVVAMLVAFVSASFELCDIQRIMKAYNSLYWFGAIMIVIGWVVVLVTPRLIRRYDMLYNDKNE